MHAIILAGGEAQPAHLPGRADLVIAADSGLHHAIGLGLTVDVIVGDFDSVDAAVAAASGADEDRHSPDKDATDLELALAHAMAAGCTEATIVGGEGGRLDHLLANALLLGSPRLAPLSVRWITATATVHVVRDRLRLDGAPGRLVTLIPIGGPARGVHTTGLRWPLAGDDLAVGTTRGVSNEMTNDIAHIEVADGALLAIQVTEEDA